MPDLLPLGPGQSPPIAVITPYDQRGVVLITIGLAIAFTLVSLVIRAYVRAGFSGSFDKDDVVITIAFVFLIAQSIAVIVASSDGFGQSVSNPQGVILGSIEKALLAADILYIVTIWMSRISSTLFFLRISRSTRHEWLSKALLITAGILAVVCVMITALRCDLSRSWEFIDQRCTGLLARWIVVTVFDIVFEIAMFMVPLTIIGTLQMAIGTRIFVLSSFATRLVAIAPLLLHFASLRSFYAWTEEETITSYAQMRPYVYKTILLGYLIIAASIPSLRPFMKATATTFGVVSGSGNSSYVNPSSTTHSKTRKSGRSGGPRPIPLTMISKGSRTRTLENDTIARDEETGHVFQSWDHADQVGYSATVSHSNARVRDSSIGSDISQQPIIRHDVHYNVTYEDTEGGNSGRFPAMGGGSMG